MMIELPETFAHWDSPQFEALLKRELQQLGAAALQPLLQRGLAQSSYVAEDAPIEVVILARERQGACRRLRLSVFYAGVITGCNCADDPTPVDLQNECCELELLLDPASCRASLSLSTA